MTERKILGSFLGECQYLYLIVQETHATYYNSADPSKNKYETRIVIYREVEGFKVK